MDQKRRDRLRMLSEQDFDEAFVQVSSADKAFELGARASTQAPERAIQYALQGAMMLAKRMGNRRLLGTLARASKEVENGHG